MTDRIFNDAVLQGGPKVVYHAPASDKAACCIKLFACAGCAPLAPCGAMHKRTYATVYDNKVEFGVVFATCCCCTCDATQVLYYDQDLTSQVSKAGCCSPCCTHNLCCPTCFDCCGEAVVLHGQSMCSFTRVLTAPCGWMMFSGYDNAEVLAQHINMARAACMLRLKGGPLLAPPQQAADMSRDYKAQHPAQPGTPAIRL